MQRVLCFSLLSPTLLDATMLECQMIMIMALSNKNQFSWLTSFPWFSMAVRCERWKESEERQREMHALFFSSLPPSIDKMSTVYVYIFIYRCFMPVSNSNQAFFHFQLMFSSLTTKHQVFRNDKFRISTDFHCPTWILHPTICHRPTLLRTVAAVGWQDWRNLPNQPLGSCSWKHPKKLAKIAFEFHFTKVVLKHHPWVGRSHLFASGFLP